MSTLGSIMQTVAVGWHAYEMTHSSMSLGFLESAESIAVLFTFGGCIKVPKLKNYQGTLTAEI